MAPQAIPGASAKGIVKDKSKNVKVPKAAQAARDVMGGGEITAENLKKKLGQKEFNNLANNFRNHMSKDVKAEYLKLSTDVERRQWLAQYVIDPTCASNLKGFNRTTAVNSKMFEGTGQWLHQSEIGGPLRLNNETMAKLLCESGKLQERDSEFERFRAKGLKQYYFSKEILKVTTGFKEEAGVEATVELKEDEFAEVKEHIGNNMGKGVVKKKAAQKEPESEEKKKRRELLTAKNTTVRKMKILIDRASNDVAAVSKDLPKLVEKGYPPAMQDWCKAKLDEMQSKIQNAHSAYVGEVGKVAPESASVAEIQEKSAHLDKALLELGAHYAEFKKTSGAELKKLIG